MVISESYCRFSHIQTPGQNGLLPFHGPRTAAQAKRLSTKPTCSRWVS